MKSDDLPYYDAYLKLIQSGEGIRVILSYPDDYIALLRENEDLRRRVRSLDEVTAKYGMELYRALAAEDKLRTLRNYLNDLGIVVPNFSW